MRIKISILLLMVCLMPTVLRAQMFIGVEGGGMTYTLITDGKEDVRDIWVENFQLSATEVTVAQWREFTIDTGMDFLWEHHYAGDISELSPLEDCPIQLVRIEEAVYFCNWLSQREGLQMVYLQNGFRIIRDKNADGYRLPTTDEWDFSARGGRLSLGYIFSGSNNPDEVAWYNLPFDEGANSVAKKAPNELGLYDMTGNIWEWTWPDIGIPYNASNSDEKINLRGGGWTSSIDQARLDHNLYTSVSKWSCNGFRLAKNAE